MPDDKLFAAAPLTLTMDQAKGLRHKPSNWWAHKREPWKQHCEDLAEEMRRTERMIAALTPRRQ